jgi:hypothetical protein
MYDLRARGIAQMHKALSSNTAKKRKKYIYIYKENCVLQTDCGYILLLTM